MKFPQRVNEAQSIHASILTTQNFIHNAKKEHGFKDDL